MGGRDGCWPLTSHRSQSGGGVFFFFHPGASTNKRSHSSHLGVCVCVRVLLYSWYINHGSLYQGTCSCCLKSKSLETIPGKSFLNKTLNAIEEKQVIVSSNELNLIIVAVQFLPANSYFIHISEANECKSK